MLKYHADNIKTLYRNFMLKIWRIHAETSCSKYRHFVMKIKVQDNSWTTIIISDQLCCMSNHFSELCNDLWSNWTLC